MFVIYFLAFGLMGFIIFGPFLKEFSGIPEAHRVRQKVSELLPCSSE